MAWIHHAACDGLYAEFRLLPGFAYLCYSSILVLGIVGIAPALRVNNYAKYRVLELSFKKYALSSP